MLTGCHSNSWSLIVYQSSVFLHYDILCCILHVIRPIGMCLCVNYRGLRTGKETQAGTTSRDGGHAAGSE